MKLLNYDSDNFWVSLDKHLSLREEETNSKIDVVVKSIIEDIKKYGDDKIVQFAKQFDKTSLIKSEIKISDLNKFYSLENLNKETIDSFRVAISNIKKYHKKSLI